MAKLILTLNNSVLGEFPLDKECLTVGRKPDNDIQIDNLAISGYHAQIITILNDSFVEDLNSTNGTYVNSKPIKKHALSDGDIITVGKHQLRYVNELSGKSEEGDRFEQTLIIRPDAVGMPEKSGQNELSEDSVAKLKEAHEQSMEATHNEATGGGNAKLQILSGANTGKELVLTKALTTFGKPGVQVAAITRRSQGYFLIHIEGGTGSGQPRVNGEDVGTQAHALHDHDIIEIANVKMEFFLER